MNKIKEFLRNKKTNRKLVYNICLIVTVFGLLFIVSGTSYALLTGSSSSDKEQIIKAGDVTLELSEYFENTSQPISVMSDTDGLLLDETYSFNLKNIGEVSARYDIKLVNEVPSDYNDGVIDDKYVKVGVEINGEEHGPFTLEEANNILDSGIIYENELISYEIRVWLNEDYEEEILDFDGYKGFFKVQVEAEQSLQERTAADTIIAKVGTDGIVAEEHPETEQLEATTDYRYTGANPNNYVEFNDELWRIIGVFPTDDGTGNIENRIKIIRNEKVGNIAWNNDESNDWSMSSLKEILNSGDYYNRVGSYSTTGLISEAKSMIGKAKWYLGGVTPSNFNNALASDFYSYERGTTVYSENSTSFVGEVGLMYPSDYGYATSGGSAIDREECLSHALSDWDSNSDCYNNDWLYANDLIQWTITADADYFSSVFYVYLDGYIGYNAELYIIDYLAVRPVIYLSVDVKITGGSGTESAPYILSK